MKDKETFVSVTTCIQRLLQALEYRNVFTVAPAAWRCSDPIVLACGSWQRESRQTSGEERGVWPVDVLVCRENTDDAEMMCRAVERKLRGIGPSAYALGGGCRVVAVDSENLRPSGRDGSGRWVWTFTLKLTVVRDIGR